MATLVEGQEYGLASSDILQGNKTVIHFKLTDSALKALEGFSKVKNGVGQRTTIQFQGSSGVIRIPSHVSPAGNRPERKFQVSLSALPGDRNGSFDCVRQTIKQGISSLQSLGSMHHRVSVHATDDVYDRTRAKMTMVEEESKKVCTKEIKPSGRHISKKVKKILPPGSLRIPLPATKPAPALKPTIASLGSARQGSASTSTLSSSSVSRPSLPASVPASASVSSTSRCSPTLGFTSSLKTSVGSKSQSRVLTSASTKQSSGAINMPYKDRIIHLLALKTFKKPELVLRLQKDGIREKDKNSLSTILQQVAVLNRDNSYSLARAAWADVREDWPFYSEHDRCLLKKNLRQESPAAPTSPAVSPASSNPESPGSTQKRTLDDPEDYGTNPNKKKRISHLESRRPEERPVSVVKPTVNQQASPDANRENQYGSVEDPEFLIHFGDIETSEQRQKYKQEFNREYVEYRTLHQEVDHVASKFQTLRSRISQAEEGTPDFEVLRKQVMEEFEAQKSDPAFMEKKRRMEYLHQKLGHIKRQIYKFDHRRQPVMCS